MGLYVSKMDERPIGERSLYIYLLDYGWPSDAYEKLFQENFKRLSARASETGAVVIMSGKGVHFANEVFDWHQICGHDATDILPAILLTHTHPNYFISQDIEQHGLNSTNGSGELGDIAIIPLRTACTTPDDFLRIIGSIFDDLDKGLTLRSFRAEKFDVLTSHKTSQMQSLAKRVGKAVMLQPNVGGVGVDLKVLFGGV
jgi:hypothetical protein